MVITPAFSMRRLSGPTIERPITKIKVNKRKPPRRARKSESDWACSISAKFSSTSARSTSWAAKEASFHSARLRFSDSMRSTEGNDATALSMKSGPRSVPVASSSWARTSVSIRVSCVRRAENTGSKNGCVPSVSVIEAACSRAVSAEPKSETRLRTVPGLRLSTIRS